MRNLALELEKYLDELIRSFSFLICEPALAPAKALTATSEKGVARLGRNEALVSGQAKQEEEREKEEER